LEHTLDEDEQRDIKGDRVPLSSLMNIFIEMNIPSSPLMNIFKKVKVSTDL
jgi:hypothetical protein